VGSTTNSKLLITAIANMAKGEELPKPVLERILSQASVKSYKERAKMAINKVGLSVPDTDPKGNLQALSHPDPNKVKEQCLFPVSPMIEDSLITTWRNMVGLKSKHEVWDNLHGSLLVNAPRSNPKLKMKSAGYDMANDKLPNSGYQPESAMSVPDSATATVSMAKLRAWNRTLASC